MRKLSEEITIKTGCKRIKPFEDYQIIPSREVIQLKIMRNLLFIENTCGTCADSDGTKYS